MDLNYEYKSIVSDSYYDNLRGSIEQSLGCGQYNVRPW